jgi:hypothetical protein
MVALKSKTLILALSLKILIKNAMPPHNILAESLATRNIPILVTGL